MHHLLNNLKRGHTVTFVKRFMRDLRDLEVLIVNASEKAFISEVYDSGVVITLKGNKSIKMNNSEIVKYLNVK